MQSKNDLTRFMEAQQGTYTNALNEIMRGRKTSHWMWFIFPQIAGLGMSETSKFYAIKDKSEAEDYVRHAILGTRLKEICTVLYKLNNNDAVTIFGTVDSLKLQSCMTLFSLTENADPIFQQILDKFYGGAKDPKTIRLLQQ